MIKSLFFLFLIAILGYIGLNYFLSDHFAIKTVEIRRSFRNLDKSLLQKKINQAIDGNFFSLDLNHLKKALLQVPWIADARIEKHWPDRLIIDLKPRLAIAQWKDQGLIDAKGQLFFPKHRPDLGLILIGSEEKIDIMLNFYYQQKKSLAKHHLFIKAIHLDPQGEWTLKLKQGIEIALGKDQISMRLNRFIEAYPFLIKKGQPRRFDLRYERGFAVLWQKEDQE